MDKRAKIYVAGHHGMVGSAIWRKLQGHGYENLLGRMHQELDLCNQAQVEEFFTHEKPEYVFLAAAHVGGILANDTYRADFISQNLAIQTNVVRAAYKHDVKRLLFLGSSCIYPRECPQPIKEEYLLSGPLEKTNEPYAVAKIAGLKMCESYNRQYGAEYFAVMPTNLYGPNDNFDLETSHVLPALIRKFVEAKKTSAKVVKVWGTGNVKREFLHVYDAAEACIHLMSSDSREIEGVIGGGVAADYMCHINVGTGQDVTIAELVDIIKAEVGYLGCVEYDRSKPDGTPRKLLEVGRMSALGWDSRIPLREGIRQTVDWYLSEGGST